MEPTLLVVAVANANWCVVTADTLLEPRVRERLVSWPPGGGAPEMVRDPELVPVPAAVVTEMVPEEAPEGTVKVREVSDTTVKVGALVAPIVTLVAPVKPVPVTVTVLPTAVVVGEKEVMVGAEGAEGEAKTIDDGYDPTVIV